MAKTPDTKGQESPSPTGAAFPGQPAPAQALVLPYGAATYNDVLLGLAKATIEKNLAGRRSGWTQEVHARALVRLALQFGLPADKAPHFLATIELRGLAGNASQFRQWLEKPQPDGPGLLEAKPTAAVLVADLT